MLISIPINVINVIIADNNHTRMSVAGTGKFVSKKVSKVRWMPISDTSQPISTTLATGSWDDESNSVVVWGGAGMGGEATQVSGRAPTSSISRLNIHADSVSITPWRCYRTRVAEPRAISCQLL